MKLCTECLHEIAGRGHAEFRIGDVVEVVAPVDCSEDPEYHEPEDRDPRWLDSDDARDRRDDR